MPRTHPSRPRPKRPVLTARTADRFTLYEDAVQAPESECNFFDRVYKKRNGRLPVILREDFCATAAICREWVRRRKDTVAYGIDLDPAPLAWARTKIAELPPRQAERLHLVQRNVLNIGTAAPKADVVSAGNFSWWLFTTRDLVRTYFKSVRASLAKDGLFILDTVGGTRVMDEMEERRRCKGFTYVWDQSAFDPLTNDYVCHIHFEFKRGPRMEKAFTYQWRLWSVQEAVEILIEAGFKKPVVYLEGDDGKGAGNGVFSPAVKGENCESFLAYIVCAG